MILITSGTNDEKAFDAQLLFAMQLAASGHQPCIDAMNLPEMIERHQKYEMSRFLVDLERTEVTRIIVIGADTLESQTLSQLRKVTSGNTVPVCAIGRFANHQALIGAQSKLAYTLGYEPQLVDLATLHPKPLFPSAISPLSVGPRLDPAQRDGTPRVLVYLPLDQLEDPQSLPMLGNLAFQSQFRLSVILPGRGREQLARADHNGLQVYGYSELSPETFANMADIAVITGDTIPGERMAGFALECLRASKPVIDATSNGAFIGTGAPALRGPDILAALPAYLTNSVIPNIQSIAAEFDDNAWMTENALSRLESLIGLEQPASVDPVPDGKTVFFPTNGNGLGHAQRCGLIAKELPPSKTASFAAFPSCTTLIRGMGFDCLPLVQRSDSHPEPFANDLVNYLRFSEHLNPHDHLVFDGGYVFDSVYRSIVEKGLNATWIRRGLWRQGQVNAKALEREKVFSSVIVPSEAFAELNHDYTFERKLHKVGPIVKMDAITDDARAGLRDSLKTQFDRDFDHLVITMLGGGVAADRSAQIQTICAMLDRRSDCLNLILTWPNATISTGLYGWKNSQVVTSQNAVKLAQAADLTISAAGYNSFHEILYHQIPSILIPQMAPFMDDQERRARAASDRGCATTILAKELLRLERDVTAYLDNGSALEIRAALAQTELPVIGNADAARHIAEARAE